MNQPLNRAQRRAMKHGRYQSPRALPLPGLMDEYTVFSGVERILDQLATGSVDAAAGNPIYLNDEGEWSEICPALDGWISCWDRIT